MEQQEEGGSIEWYCHTQWVKLDDVWSDTTGSDKAMVVPIGEVLLYRCVLIYLCSEEGDY